MKLHLASIVFLLLGTVAFAQGFRGMDWGSTPSEVQAAEGKDCVEASGDDLGLPGVEYCLEYTRTFGLIDGIVLFIFAESRLVAGAWFIEGDTYESLLLTIRSKYGDPQYVDSTMGFQEWESPGMMIRYNSGEGYVGAVFGEPGWFREYNQWVVQSQENAF